ncbi:iron-sulfur cluster biosynthesis family protein [Bacillaceae bacterium S4-13-58]
MKLNITEEVQSDINQMINGESLCLKLVYDTDECGCGVNGVPLLVISSGGLPQEEKVEQPEGIPTYIFKDQAVFFDEEMTVKKNNQHYMLTSPNRILNPRLQIIRREWN